MIVVRVQRGGVGNRPIVLGVFLERAERPGEWAAHPSAKLGTHAHGPQGRRQEAREFELDGFVQRNTEHVIQRFEMTFVFLEYQSLLSGKLVRQSCWTTLPRDKGGRLSAFKRASQDH